MARQKDTIRLRDLMGKLNDPNQVYEIVLEPNEKPLTVRQRLLKAAQSRARKSSSASTATGSRSGS